MIQSKKLSKHRKISHGFFNRKGGVSNGIYKSLNCGPGSNDKKINVKKNLILVKKKLGRNTKDIILLNQIHSNKFILIDKKFKFYKKKIKADAIITDQKKVPIAVLTADCVPILLYDSKKNIIAAIHAGWKGAFKGIISKVVNCMLKKGSKRRNIIAAIGPCIGAQSYNVKENFKKKFLKKDIKNEIFFSIKKNTIFFNLSSYVKNQLKINRIFNIDMKNIDTFPYKNNFFSARRALKLSHDDYGRNISIIMIN